MVAREILVLLVWVRVLVQQHFMSQIFVIEEHKAVIAQGLHLLPFRTEKLNLVTPMVLPKRESRKRPPYMRVLDNHRPVLFFCVFTYDPLRHFSDHMELFL